MFFLWFSLAFVVSLLILGVSLLDWGLFGVYGVSLLIVSVSSLLGWGFSLLDWQI